MISITPKANFQLLQIINYLLYFLWYYLEIRIHIRFENVFFLYSDKFKVQL